MDDKYPQTDEQKLYQLAVNERRMKKLARRAKPIVTALNLMYDRDGFCETELLLAMQMAAKVFDGMHDDKTVLGPAFGLIQDEMAERKDKQGETP